MTFSEQLVYAMTKPSKYKEMIGLKKSRFVLFVVVISMALGIINYAVPMGAFIARFGGFEKLFSQKIGKIIYENGELKDESKFEMSFNGVHFVINTDAESVDKSLLKKNGIYVTFGSKYIQMNSVVDKDVYTYQTFGYEGVVPEGFNNDRLCDLIPTIYVYLVLMYIFSSAGYFIKYAFFAFLLSFMISSINKRLELGLNFGQLFKLCFYGETLGIVISNCNAALGLLPVMMVSMITVFISVRMITNSLIYIANEKKR